MPPCNSLAEAEELLCTRVNFACYPSACTEFEGWYLFSGGDRAVPDDSKFRSGFAIKTGTASLYQWQERQHNARLQTDGDGRRR